MKEEVVIYEIPSKQEAYRVEEIDTPELRRMIA